MTHRKRDRENTDNELFISFYSISVLHVYLHKSNQLLCVKPFKIDFQKRFLKPLPFGAVNLLNKTLSLICVKCVIDLKIVKITTKWQIVSFCYVLSHTTRQQQIETWKLKCEFLKKFHFKEKKVHNVSFVHRHISI